MKKIFFAALICLFCSSALFAGPFGELNNVLDSNNISKAEAQKYLDSLAADTGQAISGGGYGLGAGIGLFGMYAALKLSAQQVSGGDKIIDKAGYSHIVYPVLQLEFGLPLRLDAIIRGSHFHDSTILGGGLRWEAVRGLDLLIPSISLQSIYTHLQTDDSGNKFNLWNLKTSAIACFGEIPFVKPYIFVSFDTADLDVKSSDYSGLSSSVQGASYGLGVNAKAGIIDIGGCVSRYGDVYNYSINVFLGV
jgi:hypothetical protein